MWRIFVSFLDILYIKSAQPQLIFAELLPIASSLAATRVTYSFITEQKHFSYTKYLNNFEEQARQKFLVNDKDSFEKMLKN